MPITRARLKISDYNENRKSRLRKQERRVQAVNLSLTSMVDMFAILVIFLLANSATVSEWVKVPYGIDLPQSAATEVPVKSATLQISKEMIYANDKELFAPSQFSAHFSLLKKWLSEVEKKGGYINVVADQHLSFGLIKKIISICQEAGFGNVNLAVQPKTTVALKE